MPPTESPDESPDESPVGTRERLYAVLLLVAVLAATIAVVPQLRVRAVAAAASLDALGVGVPRLLAPDHQTRTRTVAGVVGTWIDPADDAPPVLLVPGAAPQGREDPRVIEVAEALADSGRSVFVPQLRVYREELTVDDVDDLVAITLALAREREPVTLVGASFGGSLGLLAAADGRIEDELAMVAVFGAYADLLGVIQAGTTGTALVGERAIDWESDPRADEVIRQQLVELTPSGYRDELVAALDGSQAPDELTDDARAVYELAVHDDPQHTRELAGQAPPPLRRRLAELSPTTVADQIDTPVVAMHAADDPTIPYAELLRLGNALPDAELFTLETFTHVDPAVDGPGEWWPALGDLAAVWQFVTEVLASQAP